ncbi:energy transducer TonB [Altererythrobacter sp. ZODW24]|uniref:energy transducer TonB n=1 Tax=Altererythrobacter sp. ZODW24 TaxID=2185142 RepID=UPI0013B39B2E|nr:energy transducer TonB [Altererythrobacter sp. ZODW24]
MRKTICAAALFAIALPMGAFAQESQSNDAVVEGAAQAVAEAAEDAMEAAELAGIAPPAAYSTGHRRSNDETDPRFETYIDSLFVQIDYPHAAFVAGEEGVVDVELTVDSEGNATGCKVVRKSDFPRLDAATCPHVLKRATFKPAEDKDGNPVVGTMIDRVHWRAREQDLNSFSLHVAFTQTETGETEDCELISFTGKAPKGMPIDEPCKGFATGSALFRDEDGVPVRKRVEVKIGAEVSDLPTD